MSQSAHSALGDSLRTDPSVRALADELPDAAADAVLPYADALTAASPALARTYLRAARRAWSTLNGDFGTWSGLVVDIAVERLRDRRAAEAVLALDPQRLVAVGAETLDGWLALAKRVQGASERLGTDFVRGSGQLLVESGPELGDSLLPRLDGWVTGGLSLLIRGERRRESLVAEYFTAGQDIITALPAEQIPQWAAVGAATFLGREPTAAFFRSVPEGLAELTDEQRSTLFELLGNAGRVEPKLVGGLARGLPAAVLGLDEDARLPVLRALVPAARSPKAVLELLTVLHAVVGAIPHEAMADLLAPIETVGECCPNGVVPLLRALPAALQRAEPAGVRGWIERGIELVATSPDVGPAYFGLETRTSLRYLRAESAATHLDEVDGVLRAYARMLSGRTLELRPIEAAALRAFIDAGSMTGESIALPAKVDAFDSWEDNFAVLKMATASAVGRLLYGSYQLSLPAVLARLPESAAAQLRRRAPGERFSGLLTNTPIGDVLLGLYAACEGIRVDGLLRRRYRGYAADLLGLAGRLRRKAGHRPSVELLLYLLGAGLEPELIASEELPPSLLTEIRDRLTAPGATPEDSFVTAVELRTLVGRSMRIFPVELPKSYQEALLAAEFGIDPTDGADGDASATDVMEANPNDVGKATDDREGQTLTLEELRKLMESGAGVQIAESGGVDSAGIIAGDGWDFAGQPKDPSESDGPDEFAELPVASRRRTQEKVEQTGFDYDEWDHTIGDYRSKWAHLDELELGGDSGEKFLESLDRYADILPDVRRQFQRLRPERYRSIRGLEDGEDFDLNAAIEARVELRARRVPSSRLYVARRAEERDVATLFLLDMSASTDQSVEEPDSPPQWNDDDDEWPMMPIQRPVTRRIVDVIRDTLVIMSEALREIGDRYAIYGFSGQGREKVEFYPVKSFREGLTPTVRSRIGGIAPRRYTRMGTAVRHAHAKLSAATARTKYLFVLSDGFPQDVDYGEDRTSGDYGIQDTMMAIRECQADGITPFFITIDRAGHDYLRQMCENSRYLVIDDVTELPTQLPKIYERWVRA